jgi:hypothetical protein
MFLNLLKPKWKTSSLQIATTFLLVLGVLCPPVAFSEDGKSLALGNQKSARKKLGTKKKLSSKKVREPNKYKNRYVNLEASENPTDTTNKCWVVVPNENGVSREEVPCKQLDSL